MDELIAFFNKLSTFFNSAFEEAGQLYPNGQLPLRPVVLVHSSLAAFGEVPGGAGTVVAALSSACEKNQATLVMPAHTDPIPHESSPDARITASPEDRQEPDHENTEKTGIENWIAQEPVCFDKKTSACTRMGKIPEYFRTMPGTKRSDHPILSFCASGPEAKRILHGHRCETGLGPHSPAGKLCDRDALILMLGTGFETCTVMHLAEYVASERSFEKKAEPDRVTCSAYVTHRFSGYRLMVWEDIAYNPERFAALGNAFETEHPEKIIRGKIPSCGGRVSGKFRLMRARDILDFCIDRYPVLG